MTDTTSEIDSHLFRHAMGRFATGVTVITVRDGGTVRGMTANAFMSGSLEPPLLVISVAKRARMHATMLEAERFGVNILAESQRDISEHFAGQSNPALSIAFAEHAGVPLLDDACARMAAKNVAEHDCGDHTIFIGRILYLDADDRLPLIYHGGRYRGLDRGGEVAASALDTWEA